MDGASIQSLDTGGGGGDIEGIPSLITYTVNKSCYFNKIISNSLFQIRKPGSPIVQVVESYFLLLYIYFYYNLIIFIIIIIYIILSYF